MVYQRSIYVCTPTYTCILLYLLFCWRVHTSPKLHRLLYFTVYLLLSADYMHLVHYIICTVYHVVLIWKFREDTPGSMLCSTGSVTIALVSNGSSPIYLVVRTGLYPFRTELLSSNLFSLWTTEFEASDVSPQSCLTYPKTYASMRDIGRPLRRWWVALKNYWRWILQTCQSCYNWNYKS